MTGSCSDNNKTVLQALKAFKQKVTAEDEESAAYHQISACIMHILHLFMYILLFLDVQTSREYLEGPTKPKFTQIFEK